LYPSTNRFNGSLIITIDGGKLGPLNLTIPNQEMSNPLRGINTNGERVVQPNVTEASVFFENAPLDTMVIGKVGLSQVSFPVGGCSGQVLTTSKVYMIVNWHDKQFHLAPLAQTSEDTPLNLTSFNSTTCSNPEISDLASYSWVKSHDSWIWPNILVLWLVQVSILGCFFWKFIQRFSLVRRWIGNYCVTRGRKKAEQQSHSRETHNTRDTAAAGDGPEVGEHMHSSTETVVHPTAPELPPVVLRQSEETTGAPWSRGSDIAPGEGSTNTHNSLTPSLAEYRSGTSPTQRQSLSSPAAQRR
jgi:hypothetical protein